MIGFTSSLQGLASSEAQFNQAAWQIARSSESTAPGGQDTVDLSAAAVAMLQAKNNFDANTKAIKVGDELDRYWLNAVG